MSNHQKTPAPTATIITTSHPHSLLGVLRVILEKYRHSRQLRKLQRDARTAFLPTLRLDDKMLEDIGVTREEAAWAASLPLERNAAKAMHARARSRRQDEVSPSGPGSARSCATGKGFSARSIVALRPSLPF